MCLLRLRFVYTHPGLKEKCVIPVTTSDIALKLTSFSAANQSNFHFMSMTGLGRRLSCALMMLRNETPHWSLTQTATEMKRGKPINKQMTTETWARVSVCIPVLYCLENLHLCCIYLQWICVFMLLDLCVCVCVCGRGSWETGWPFRGPPSLKLSCSGINITISIHCQAGLAIKYSADL